MIHNKNRAILDDLSLRTTCSGLLKPCKRLIHDLGLAAMNEVRLTPDL
jgi:hypothetical protein